MTELKKPCPFCGSKSVSVIALPYNISKTKWMYRLYCDCRVEMVSAYGELYDSEKEAEEAAIKAWNTRAEPEETPVKKTPKRDYKNEPMIGSVAWFLQMPY